MFKTLKLLIIITITMTFILPFNCFAKTTVDETQINGVSKYVQIAVNETGGATNLANNFDNKQNCKSLLGNPSDDKSVAWLLVKVLNYLRILGPLLVVVLSGIEFAKTIVTSDDEHMKKTENRLVTRLILVAVLFLIPTLTKLLLQIFNVISDPMCGIE